MKQMQLKRAYCAAFEIFYLTVQMLQDFVQYQQIAGCSSPFQRALWRAERNIAVCKLIVILTGYIEKTMQHCHH